MCGNDRQIELAGVDMLFLRGFQSVLERQLVTGRALELGPEFFEHRRQAGAGYDADLSGLRSDGLNAEYHGCGNRREFQRALQRWLSNAPQINEGKTVTC